MSQVIQYRYGSDLYSFNTGGWFNATEAAARFGKEPFYWLNQRDTVEYIVALAKHLGNEDFNSGFVQELNKIKALDGAGASSRVKLLRLAKKTGFVRIRTGAPDTGGGTWFHPKLAIPFARWLDVHFGVWCDLQIDTIIRGSIQAQGKADLIPLYLRPDATPWEKRFPESYYRALARVTRTDYHGHTGGTPAVFGQMTDLWVYGCILPADVHDELKTRRGDSQKMHQWLTGGGVDMLDKQIHLVVAIASTSADARDFSARMMVVSGTRGQLGFIYPAVSAQEAA